MNEQNNVPVNNVPVNNNVDTDVSILTELIELKAGKHTTELLVLGIGMVITVLVSIGALTVEQAEMLRPVALSLFLMILYVSKVYIEWRGKLKLGNMELNKTLIQSMSK